MPQDRPEESDEKPSNGDFLRACRKDCKLSQIKVAELTGISERRLRDAEKHDEPLDANERKLLAGIYRINDPSLFIRRTDTNEALLFQAGGLCGSPPVEGKDAFQDYECGDLEGAEEVNCPVAVLWADSRCLAHASANICYPNKPGESSYLRVEFRNGLGASPVSVGIHPQFVTARRLGEGQIGLRFRALLLENANAAATLYIAIRVSDASHRQWEYRKERMFHRVFPLRGPSKAASLEKDVAGDRWRILALPEEKEWTKVDVFIKGGGPGYQWSPFLHNEEKAVLDVITRITLEIGHQEDKQRPRGGEGVVLISPITIIGDGL